ncbi:MAG: O-antigen ligase family protein [Pseudomonadota bacterium]
MILGSRFDGPLARLQGSLGWLALTTVFLAVLPRGGDLPIVWTLLALSITGLFAVHVLFSFFRPAAIALSRAVWPALLFGAAVTWGLMQVLPPAPTALAHPVWALAPTGAIARIGADPGQGAHVVLRLATYAMIAWLFVACALNEMRAWAYVKAIALFSMLIALYAIWAMAGGSNPLSGVVRFGPSYTTGPFVSRNAYACYAAFGLFANIAVYLHYASRGLERGGNRSSALRAWLENLLRGGWIFLAGTLLCGAALALSQSRAGVASALLGLVVFAGCMLKRQRGAQTLVWIALVGLLSLIGYTYGQGTLERLLAFESSGGRFEIYARMLPVIAERPLLGQGIGAFHDTFRAHVPAELAHDDWLYAHNSYLENAYELGLPAAAALYLALFLVTVQIAMGVRAAKHPHTRTSRPSKPGDARLDREPGEAEDGKPERNTAAAPGFAPGFAPGGTSGAPLDLNQRGNDAPAPLDHDPILPAMALAVLTTAAAHSVIDYPLQLPGVAALFAVLIGIGWAQSFSRDQRRSQPRSEMTNDI